MKYQYVQYVIRTGEHIGFSPLTNKMVQPRTDSAICNHFFEWVFVTLFAALFGLLWSVFHLFYGNYYI